MYITSKPGVKSSRVRGASSCICRDEATPQEVWTNSAAARMTARIS